MAETATYSFFLITSRDGDSTNSPGSPFQCPVSLSVESKIWVGKLHPMTFIPRKWKKAKEHGKFVTPVAGLGETQVN